MNKNMSLTQEEIGIIKYITNNFIIMNKGKIMSDEFKEVLRSLRLKIVKNIIGI